ncbi:MAG: phospho-N-acetylmuramoyl-pentapeptide-transferase [Lachnospiraceae bacterium]|nr:phospho-N-acetylmuramoyl-pentapeptide-transferase [Lachnospiraceae bacterium]
MQTNIVIGIIAAFVLSTLLCPIMIPFLKKLKFGQYIREEGPREHRKKSGTPTMGGLVIVLAAVIPSLFYVKSYPNTIPILFMTLGFGLIGFLDDYIKVVMKRNLGLRAWQKMALQMVVTAIFAVYLLELTDLGTSMLIPFLKKEIELPTGVFVALLFFVVVGTVNGANLTDGLDGLASGVTVIISVFFTVVSIVLGGGVEPMTGAIAGSLLGFLLFNVYPARVFMGDTGSLALGGFVAATAYMLKIPLILLLVAFIYVMEVVSVIIQVTYFKLTHGKRYFKMAPIHHHFELCGWSETRIVAAFGIITALLCLIAYKGV